MSPERPSEASTTASVRKGGRDRSPTRLSSAATMGAALLAFAILGRASLVAFSLGALGAVSVLGGLAARNRGLVTAGAVVLFVGVLAAGVAEASAPSVLVATGAVLFAWDVERTAVDLGRHLGTAAETKAIELRHAAVSLSILTLSGCVGYAAFRLTGGSRPVLAVIALLVAGVLLSLVLE